MSRMTAVLWAAGLWFAPVVVCAAPAIVSASPQGEVAQVRQVTVKFSEAVVPFGDPRLADPFAVQCDGDAARLKGRGRWVDARNWSYDFESDLPAGQRCRFTLKPDAKDANGRAIDGGTHAAPRLVVASP